MKGEYADSDLDTFGSNRDGKKGHEQVVIGLLCNAEWCPIGTEVFRGNTKDSTTALAQVRKLRDDYGLDQMIWVGDRGTITQANAALINSTEDLHSISALTHSEIVKLLDRKVLQAELFDDKNIVEVLDSEDPTKPYCLCRNPVTTQRECKTRRRRPDCIRKTVSLEMRPIYQKTDDQIRSHVFICVLAYYLQWYRTERLKPLFESDGKARTVSGRFNTY